MVRTLMVVALLLAALASAGILVQSDFTGNDEGWRVGDLYFVSPVTVPEHLPAGGNPGGFIRTVDVCSWNAHVAPGAYLGDQSAALAGTLRFDTRIVSSDGVSYDAVVLEGAGRGLGYTTPPPAIGVWSSFIIPLSAAGWHNYTTGLPATAADLAAVLAGLTALRIDADWQTGSDQVDLDNVMLVDKDGIGGGVVPEPATLAMLASGVSTLALARRLRR